MKYLCLNCWRTTPREDAYFRCEGCSGSEDSALPGESAASRQSGLSGNSGGRVAWMRRRGGPRKRIRHVRRPWWSKIFADDADDRHPCPKHPKADCQLFCECGYPLSQRSCLRQGTPVGLGVAGPRSAGKTLLMMTMMHELHALEQEDKKLGAVGVDDTETRFHELSRGFFDRGDKPHATPLIDAETPRWDEQAELPPGNFGWMVSVEGKRGRGATPMLLTASDLGGETWGLPSHQRRERFDRYLGLLGSLLFLLDGATMAADLGWEPVDAWDQAPPMGDHGATARQWFSRVLTRLGQRARQVDLALVVSKADHLWQSESWRELSPSEAEVTPEARRDLLEKLLLETRHRDILIEARQRFRKVELFAVSSLGFLPAGDDVDDDGHLRRPATPTGVLEPLLWLLQQRMPALR